MKLKKITALLLALFMVFSLCACGKMTPEKLMAGMAKALLKAESFSGTMDTDMDIDISLIGTEINLETELDAEIAYSDGITYAHGAYTVDINDRNTMDTPIESYTVIEGGNVTNYSLSDGQWYKSDLSSSPSERSGGFDLSMIKELLSAENIGTVTLRENLETVNGEDVYVLDIDNCRYTQLAIDLVLPQIENSLGEIDFSKIDFSGIEMDLVLKVYKSSKLPAELTVSYGDSFTSVMADAADVIWESIGSQFDNGFDFLSKLFDNLKIDIAVPDVTLVINFKEYNKAAVTLPPAALNAKDAQERPKTTIFDFLI